MQGNVALLLVLLAVELGLLADGADHSGTLEVLPDYFNGQVGGVAHVGPEIAVVAQLVEDQLVGGVVDK